MAKLMTIKWEIHDTRNENGGFRTGTSKLVVTSRNTAKAMNAAIDFARYLPDWELEINGIDKEEYREYPKCCYHYRTELVEIVKIENLK